MKTKAFILFAAITIVFAACSQVHSHDNVKETSEADKVAQHQHQEVVKLDNGKKWKANPETTQGIKNMRDMVKTQMETGKTDAVKLQQNLNKEFNTILQKCTMTGEAHNQLHNYLIPIKDKIKKLSANTPKAEIQELMTYLDSYKTYFE
jgi:hypothetical protein